MKRNVLIICVLIFIDQLSKWYVINLLKDIDVIEVFSYLQLIKVWNTGISFGMLHDFAYSNIIFCGVSVVITFVLFCLLVSSRKFDKVPISIIIGGSIGNIVDRIRCGAVYDFIDFYIDSWHWPAFNLADSFIFLGVLMMLRKNLIASKIESSR